MLKKFSPQKFQVKYKTGTPLDQFGICGDNRKIIKDSGYKPKIKFKDGLKDFINLNFGIQ